LLPYELDRLLRGDEFTAAYVSDGSASDEQAHELTAGKLTPKAGSQIAAPHGGQWPAISRRWSRRHKAAVA